MKNKYINISLFLASTLFVASCAKKLEVEPTQSIGEEAALSTSRDVEVTLVGCYDGIQDVDVYGGAFQYMSELLGDNGDVRFGGTYSNLLELAAKQMTTANSTANANWRDSYVAINRVNNVLSAIDIVDASKKDKVEGEAKFLRGSLYFDLVRAYAKAYNDGNSATNLGVPIVLNPTRNVTDADFKPRNTVAEVYTQVIEDLTRAAQILPISNTIYANKTAAYAMLSRVYLQQKNYAKALEAANAAIEIGEFQLSPTIESLYNTYLNNAGANPKEYIFAIVNTAQKARNDLNSFYGVTLASMPGSSGRGDMRIQAAHLALYEKGDARGEFFVNANNNTYTMKHLDTYGNIPLIRLAEMYLTRAEANFRLNSKVGASPVSDINLIRERAGLKPLTAVTLVEILKERKLELMFEGAQVHDQKRLEQTRNGVAWNSSKLIMPIPQGEIDTNKKLVQNEGY